jgi:hypothetical protein
MADSDLIMAQAADTGYQARVKYYFAREALVAGGEADTVEDHEQRLAFAGLVLAGDVDLYDLATATLTNLTLAGRITSDPPTEIPDTELDYVVQAEVFTPMAVATMS